MQVLHNGSAPASQAGCVGSIPITCSSSSQATYGLRRFLLHKIRLRLLRCSSLSSANASLVCVRIKGQKDIAEKLGDVFFGIQGMLSGNRSRCSHSLRQVGSALRRGFAVFLRKCSRVIVYLPRACRGKYIFHSLTAKYRHPAELMPSPYAASAARRKSGVPICHDMRMANLFDSRGPHKIRDFVGRGRCRACPTDEVLYPEGTRACGAVPAKHKKLPLHKGGF